MSIPPEPEGCRFWRVIDLIRVEREVRVVKIYGSKGGVASGAFGNLGRLRIVYENGKTAEDDCLYFEEIVKMDPDCNMLALKLQAVDILHLREVKLSPPDNSSPNDIASWVLPSKL